MKKRIYCLAMCIMLVLSACSQDKTSNNAIQTLTERVYLYVPSQGVIGSVANDDFKTASEYGLYMTKENVVYDEMKESTALSPEGKKTLKYVYSSCKKKNDSSEELGTHYSRYDVYMNEEGVTVEKLHGSEIMAYYFKPYNRDTNYPEMNESQVREIAEQFLKENVSENVLGNFEFDHMGTDALGRYSLLYQRYVEGYRTDETISIWVDRNGQVSGYNGYNLGKYDNLDERITQKDISSSEKLLINKLNSMNEQDLKCNGIRLITDTTGNLFLEMYVSYISVEGTEYGEIFVVSVVDE